MAVRKYFCIIVLSLAILGLDVSPSNAQSHQAELYTMGPGDALFSKFGHAALCVAGSDPLSARCFNYGTADFSRPVGLTWDVLRGQAEFFVSVVDKADMLASFKYQDRTIYRQALPLDDENALQLSRALDHDASPENRHYAYNHFLDNCSTKPRDLIDNVTAGALSLMTWDENLSYRNLIDEGMGHSLLLISLSDLFLGRRLEHGTTPYEAMFLPQVLRRAVHQELGAAPEILYTRRAPLPPGNAGAARRWIWIVSLFFAATTLLSTWWGAERVARTIRIVAGSALGGLGTLLLLMAIASPEVEIRHNENLLVFLATDWLFVIGGPGWLNRYASFRVAELLSVGALAAAGILIQPLWPFWCAAFALPSAVVFQRLARSRA